MTKEGFALSLDLGKFESPSYGTSENLKAVIPLLGARYEIPKILKHRSALQELCTEFLEKYSLQKEGEKKFAAISRILPLVASGIYQMGNQIEDDMKNPCVLANIYTAELKNVPGKMSGSADTLRKYQFIKKSLNGLSSENKINEAGKLTGGSAAELDFILCAEAAVPDLKSADKYLTRAAAEATYGILFQPSGTRCQFYSNRTADRNLDAFTNGAIFNLECKALFDPKSRFPEKIRDEIAFRLLLGSFANAVAGVTCLISLKRDMEKSGGENRNRILHDVVHGGLTLQRAFDKAARETANDVADMQFGISILLECFLGENGLKAYLDHLTHSFDGCCHKYADEDIQKEYLVYPFAKIIETGATGCSN